MQITKLGIVGAGRRGSEIARIAAQQGLSVILIEANRENLEKGVGKIKNSVDDQIRRKKLSEEERGALMGRIQLSLDLLALSQVDFVIETIVEEETPKIDLFKQLDECIPEGATLASNALTVSVTQLAQATRHPARVIGMHFVMPIREMNLVEIVRGVKTGPESVARAKELAEKMQMQPIFSNDFPGCVVNRILALTINEAIYALYEGIGTAEDIDKTLSIGREDPLGPLKLADVIGLDQLLGILKTLHRQLGDSKYIPCPLLVKYVEAGYLGEKTGRGFFEYK